MKKSGANGFTLVELAIVLMIIGLLIGGVLRGQELMNNARITSLIKQVNSYDGAVNTFQDAYGQLPGDMRAAESRLPNCDLATTFCQGGNGNGIVGEVCAPWEGGQYLVNMENVQFWKHLALTHLISGVEPNASTPGWGKTQPYSAFRGGFDIVQSNPRSGSQGGLILRLHGCIDCMQVEQESGAGDGSPVSPREAARIDRKMDDGVPSTGEVQAAAYPQPDMPESDCEGPLQYNETNDTPFCVMNFALRK